MDIDKNLETINTFLEKGVELEDGQGVFVGAKQFKDVANAILNIAKAYRDIKDSYIKLADMKAEQPQEGILLEAEADSGVTVKDCKNVHISIYHAGAFNGGGKDDCN